LACAASRYGSSSHNTKFGSFRIVEKALSEHAASMRDNVPEAPTSKNQLGTLAKPKNLMKSFGSLVPGASVALEMLNQLDGERVDARIGEAEAQLKQIAEAQGLLAQALSPSNGVSKVPAIPPAFRDWSEAAGEFMPRSAIVAVAFDGGFHNPRNTGRERFNAVGHGCLIAPNEVLTCREVMDLVTGVATHKGGRGVAIVGMAWYEFEAGPIDDASGLCILKLTKRDDEKWTGFQDSLAKIGGPSLVDSVPAAAPVKHSLMPWIGQEVAFIHTGEAENASAMFTFEHLQFDSSVISHFVRTSRESLKTFVTGVLPGRVLYSGAGVFGRDGTLLGILSDTESYASDAGRRALVRSLVGHPKFTPRRAKTTG
jgi:hypothetical protein